MTSRVTQGTPTPCALDTPVFLIYVIFHVAEARGIHLGVDVVRLSKSSVTRQVKVLYQICPDVYGPRTHWMTN